jgi:hypothetical protein
MTATGIFLSQVSSMAPDNKLSKHETHPGLGITEDVDQLLHDPENAAPMPLSDINEDLEPGVEVDEGAGRLVSRSGDPLDIVVDYMLRVKTPITGESGVSSPPRVQHQYSLQVKPSDGQQLADGQYNLETSHEILEVLKVGENWTVKKD